MASKSSRMSLPSFRPRAGLSALALSLAATLSLAAGCDDDDGPFTPAGADGGADAAAGQPGIDAAGGTGGSDAGSGADGGGARPDGGAGTDGAVAAAPVETEIAVVRLNPDGKPDTTFGTAGIARIDFGDAAGTVTDSVYGLALDKMNRPVLFGSAKGDLMRTDQDRIVARLTAGGAPDTGFGAMGIHRLNIGNLTDQPRHGFVQDDGKIVASGYLSQPTGAGAQAANAVVLLRLADDGKTDDTFGVKGVVNSNPFMPADPMKTEWGMAEAYGVVPQGGKYVTAGYGRPLATTMGVDLVSFRYTATGELDRTWGTNGVVALDLIGADERGRNLVPLLDGRVLVVGSGTPVAMNVNAMAVMLGPNGALDTTFDGDGHKLWDFGRANEGLFGAAVSPDGKWAAAVGYRTGPVSGAMEDDDAVLVLLPLAGGMEVAKAVPLSETAHDRFLGAAFGPDNKLYAAGFLDAGTDRQMVVACYTVDGALDPSFGTAGVATINVVTAGTVESAAGIAIDRTGKIVIAGAVEKR